MMSDANAATTYSPHLLGATAAGVFLISIVGTSGNLLAVMALLQDNRLRHSPSTAFMVNLPACLLPVCALGMPLFGVGCLQVLYYGRVTFPTWLSVTAFTVGLILSQVHLHTICALAFNRLLAVVCPMAYKRLMQHRKVKIYLMVLWMYSVLLWLPLACGVFGRLEFVEEELMVSMTARPKVRKAIHVFFTYVLPILFASVCYITMYIKVRHSRRSREIRVRRKSVAAKKEDDVVRQWDDHVTRTILVIFLALISCSLPHIVIHVLHLYDRQPAAWLLLHLVFWLQFCLDPVVYVTMSSQYRAACVDTLRYIGLIKQSQTYPPASNSLNAQSSSGRDMKPKQEVHFVDETKLEPLSRGDGCVTPTFTDELQDG